MIEICVVFVFNLTKNISHSLLLYSIDLQTAPASAQHRLRFVANVLNENKELVIGPAITLVPQLFSLPLFLVTFILDCQNLENSWLRYLLIISYLISFLPQSTSFLLYILPSSFYSDQWRRTKMGKWVYKLFGWHAAPSRMKMTVLSGTYEATKEK